MGYQNWITQSECGPPNSGLQGQVNIQLFPIGGKENYFTTGKAAQISFKSYEPHLQHLWNDLPCYNVFVQFICFYFTKSRTNRCRAKDKPKVFPTYATVTQNLVKLSELVVAHRNEKGRSIETSCTVIMLENYADPLWLPVKCDVNLTNIILCEVPKQTSNESVTFSVDKKFCPVGHVSLNTTCYTIEGETNITSTWFVNSKNLWADLQRLFAPPSSVENHEISRYIKKRSAKLIQWNSATSFLCLAGFISVGAVCDGTEDCENKADENSCWLVKFLAAEKVFSIFSNNNWNAFIQAHISENSLSPSGNDLCEMSFRCFPDQNITYSFDTLCLFEISVETETLLTCNNGAHLADCTTFQCTRHFKCPNYYCIPWAYVCDRKQDCPGGEDEQVSFCFNRNCAGMFKCRNQTGICVHFTDICDGKKDCVDGDDEIFCDLAESLCSAECQCLKYIMVCTRLSKFDWCFPQPFLIISINTSGIMAENLPKLLHFKRAVWLKLEFNNLTTLHFKPNPKMALLHADFCNNQITHLTESSFQSFQNVTRILICKNMITSIKKNTFLATTLLRQLDVADNNLKQLHPTMFRGPTNLLTLNLLKNPMRRIHLEVLSERLAAEILTNSFQVCCFVQKSVCVSRPKWPSSCQRIIASKSLIILAWIMSVSAVLANTVALANCYTKISSENQSQSNSAEVAICYNRTVFCTHLSALLFGVHISVLCLANSVFGQEYIAFDLAWRESFTCNSLSFLSLQTVCLPPFYLCILALSRFDVTKNPLDPTWANLSFVTRVLQIGSSIVFLVCICVSVVQNLFEEFLQSLPLCLSYGTFNSVISQVISGLVGTVQLISSLWTVGFNMGVLYQLKIQSDDVLGTNHLTTARVVKLVLTSLTYSVCCLPSSGLMFTSSTKTEYPIELLHWVVLFSMPSYYVSNPISLHTKFAAVFPRRFQQHM